MEDGAFLLMYKCIFKNIMGDVIKDWDYVCLDGDMNKKCANLKIFSLMYFFSPL